MPVQVSVAPTGERCVLLSSGLLGLQADAPNGRLHVDPARPRWLPDVTLQGLAVGGARVDLRFRRVGERSEWDATVRHGEIEVSTQPWTPTRLAA